MTTDAKHTPEPWTEEYQPTFSVIHGPDGEDIAVTGSWRVDEYPEMRANAARIVACVNACAGIPTEQLEKGSVQNWRGAFERIAAIASDYEDGQRMSATDVAHILVIARAALAPLDKN